MYRILLILYIIWGGVSIASGQDFNYSFTQLSTNQGLSQASVTSVTMDQKGRLWIGTQSGLNYYFQQQLKTFIHHESDSLSIIRKSKFPQNPKRSVRFSGKRTKRSVQKRKARNTQKAETKVL